MSHMSIEEGGLVLFWRFIGFYGEPITHKGHELWELLLQLHSQFNLPWLCAGDFKEILKGVEKQGGSNRSHAHMQLFRDTMDKCGFIDMGFNGNPFTWKKYFRDGQIIQGRLDRILAKNEWLLRFGGSTVHHLTCNTSDHCPLLIILEMVEPANPEKSFCFEEMWLAKKGCSNIVKQEWSKQCSRNIALGIVPKIENCGKALKRWSSKNFRSV